MESKVVAFVHDSIAIDIHPGEFFESYDLLYYSMKTLPEQMDWVTAPLGVDIDISDNYGDHVTVKSMDINEDGSRTFTLSGYDYVHDNVVNELRFNYDIVENEILEEHEFVEDVGDGLIARKTINLSYDGKKFMDQTRKITIRKR